MGWDVYEPERPWEPQPCDSSESFHWLGVWLLQGPQRRLDQLRQLGCGWDVDRLHLEAREGAWRLRAEAYDAHLRARLQAAMEDELEEQGRAYARRIGMARRMAMLGDGEVRRMLRLQDQTGGQVPVVSERTAMHMVRAGIAVELAVEAAAKPDAVKPTRDPGKLSDAELDLLAELEEKMMAS